MTTDLRSRLTAAYADVSLGDPLADVVRRGRRIRRARRARRTVPAVVAAAAVVVGLAVTRGGNDPFVPAPIDLVGQQTQAFPLSFAQVPAGLDGPHLSLDPSFHQVGPGAAQAGWSDPDDPGTAIGIQVEADEPSSAGDEVDEVRIGGEDATVRRTDVTGGSRFFSVTWERHEDQWVTVSGQGRFASERSVVALARQVVDRATPVPLQLTLAPRGWVVVAYKEDRILTLADPAGPPATDATARTLNAYLPQAPSDPADLPREVGAVGPVTTAAVHGRPAYLLRTADGWFVQAAMADGTVFVLQAPGDFTRAELVELAEGVRRP